MPKAYKLDNEAKHDYLTSVLPRGLRADAWYGYVKGWWPLRDEPNVLLVHFSDLRRNLKGEIERIAKVGLEGVGGAKGGWRLALARACGL